MNGIILIIMKKRIYVKENNEMEGIKQKNEKKVKEGENNKGKNESITQYQKIFSSKTQKNEFTKNNIDFEDLKKQLNKIYDDEKLTTNAINFIRKNLNSSFEVQWETNNKNKIINKKSGERGIVKPSLNLILRAKKGMKTPQVLHNHTLGIPLPHAVDISNTKNFKIMNNNVVGEYGILNIKNSFKALNSKQISKFERMNNEFYEKIKKEFIKNNPQYYNESPKVQQIPKYKYYKSNIERIVKDYNKQFNEFGIEFEYTPYKLKKR